MTLRIFSVLISFCAAVLFISGCNTTPDLQWNEENGYRWAELHPGYFGNTGFKERTASQTGIKFINSVSDDTIAENRHFANGSGVAVGDVTGDGLADIYFASLEGPNKLYKNLGNFTFEDITDQAGVAHEGFNSTGTALVDINGNGHLDLLITSLSDGNSLYLNDGSGFFTLNENSGLGESYGAHSMALADINGNGLPDLYIANYRLESVRDLYGPDDLSMENTTVTENGRLQILPEFQEFYKVIEIDGQEFRQETGAYDELYINLGNGKFQRADLTEHFPMNIEGESGLFKDWGFTPIFKDITGNGLPDLYVTNDFWTPDRLWINQGNGIFQAAVQNAIKNQSFSSMGVDIADLDKNGEPDIVVTEMLSGEHERRLRQYSDYMGEFQGSTHHNHNSVYLNRGDSTFAQIAYLSGLEATEWSWATKFMDVNLDGHEDLIVATGFYRDYLDMDAQQEIHQRYRELGEAMMAQGGEFLRFPTLELTNKIFSNNGDLTFTDKSSDWGFTAEDISMGMAAGDLNNDGSLDLVINRFNEEAVIYKNTTNKPRIAVRLKGKSPNTGAIGASVELIGGPVIQHKEMSSGGTYLSDSQNQIVFAPDETHAQHTIIVRWRDGTESRIENVSANRLYEISQPETAEYNIRYSRSERESQPMFLDISNVINHTHHESSYNDFQRVQPLLPKELSRKGPGVAWFDYNESGYEDLFITEGKGGLLQIFENFGDNHFIPAKLNGLDQENPGDQVSISGWKTDNGLALAVGSSNYEQGNPNVASAYIYRFENGEVTKRDSIPGILSGTGPIAAADYSGNGSIDMFIGGHFLPGGYPRDASSRLFSNVNEELQLDIQNSELFTNAGLVNAALFADFTQNNRQDLLLSTEWGALKLFENRNGRFHEITAEMGLDLYRGWWNGIASGDFTNNGLTDFVALNIGLNSPYKLTSNRALRLYYEDLNLNNRLDIVDAYYHEDLNTYVPRRKLLDFRSIPTILRNVASHAEFSESPVDIIFNYNFEQVPFKEINTLHHLVFLNTGDGFEVNQLPLKAQISTGYHVGVADFDNDGNEDLFISQNSFEHPPAVAKQDAGRGLVMMGDGTGSFEPIPGSESGIKIYGEQRGAAFSDFNNNGKTDIAVSQNGGQTKLYVNNTKKRGIRVHLEGPPSNRIAIGSGIRVVYDDGTKGPLRTIQAGSGYRSQNSAVQVLGYRDEPAAIEILWFNGRTSRVEYVKDQLEYIVSYP